ncbi:MAG: alpha/beta hydrolase [Hyphomonadaceae bacterium]|nr:alpha/beta hydrolase [Hyphomonadaceae bacterium]
MSRKILVALVALMALPIAGASYEAIASVRDAQNLRAPGELIDVGGYRLHLNCTGEGVPTVVLDAGLGGGSLDWTLVQPELSRTTHTCSFDRAGMGWSDPGRAPRSPEHIADELAVLLDRADIDGPYVLVAHSLAAKNARLFAMRHPEDVVGMVFVDARHEYVDEQTTASEQQAFLAALDGQSFRYGVVRRLGVVRLFGDQLAGVPSMTAQARLQMALIATEPEALVEMAEEGQERSASDDLLRNAPSLGELPLVAIAAGPNMSEPRWAEGQRRLAALSASGRLVVAQGSSHAVEWDDPELVIATVREVIAAARSR